MKTLVLILLLFSLKPAAEKVTVKIEDVSGGPLKDQLVIIQDLNGQEREVVRALSNEAGTIPPLGLPPGLYRAIATTPYGVWETKVHEFLVTQTSTEVVLQVSPRASRGEGDVVTVGAPMAQLHVVDSTGKPVANASVLVRDEEATVYSEHWYKTNQDGDVNVKLSYDPTVVVVHARDTLTIKVAQPKTTALTIQLSQ